MMAKNSVYKYTKTWAKKNGTLGSGRDLAERAGEAAANQKSSKKQVRARSTRGKKK